MKINAIPVVIGILLIFGAVVLTAVPVSATYSSRTDSSTDGAEGTYTSTVEVVGPDGETIQVTPYRIMSFYWDSKEVTKVEMTISWDIQGTNLDYDTLTLDIECVVYNGITKKTTWTTTPSERTVISAGEGNVMKTWDLSALLTTDESQILTFMVSIDVSVQDIYGNTLYDSVRDEVNVPFTYAADSGTLSVTGGIGYTPMDSYSGVLSVMPSGMFLFGTILLIAGICVLSKR